MHFTRPNPAVVPLDSSLRLRTQRVQWPAQRIIRITLFNGAAGERVARICCGAPPPYVRGICWSLGRQRGVNVIHITRSPSVCVVVDAEATKKFMDYRSE